MLQRIGILLPRSTDYPAMGYDLLDGLRYGLKQSGNDSVKFSHDSIGFGENAATNYSKAEHLFLENDLELLIVYSGSTNAEMLYPLAEGMQKPILFVDPGMQFPTVKPSPWCYHISLQGIHAAYHSGCDAGKGKRSIVMATSFFDGGFRGSYYADKGLANAGGEVKGNFVSGYKTTEFTVDPFITLVKEREPQAIIANFSTYLSELFFNKLNEHPEKSIATSLPFYCSPFMGEEQALVNCNFPGGDYHTVVPWATTITNPQQELFTNIIAAEKKKTANIFHLLGWEAAMVATQMNAGSPDDFSYQSPRGKVTMDATTHYTYAPLYNAKITGNDAGKCQLKIESQLDVTREQHQSILIDQSIQLVSGWKNNYFCS